MIEKDLFKKRFSARKEILYTWIGLAVTLTAAGFVFAELSAAIRTSLRMGHPVQAAHQIGFTFIVTVLIYGNVVYQVTRLGYLTRLKKHRPQPIRVLERSLAVERTPPLTILIPSYKEEARVIRQSLLSSALQNYPNRRVVLLIDNPPNPTNPDELLDLIAARRLPQEIAELLQPLRAKCEAVYQEFLAYFGTSSLDLALGAMLLSDLNLEIAEWFEAQARSYPIEDHTDSLFVRMTFHQPAENHRAWAAQIPADLRTLSEASRWAYLQEDFHRLARLFQVEMTHFERKRFVNLSHAPNKAMNLNSYLGLIGRHFREASYDDGMLLEPAEAAQATLHVPAAKYLITLDADSVLSPDYALRLVSLMEQPGNERLAVAQTPYSAFPDAPGVLERIAGATTDLQYVVHQGFERHAAAFWVGANALLRKSALDDIATRHKERGFPVTKFIQDRTVIEDTESSVDLIARGWRLHNYPERLSYSATPPDFGSLIIQRGRWANGGLLILPKLLGHLMRAALRPRIWREGFLRFHYLFSIAGATLGLLVILVFPMEKHLSLGWLPLTALPYYALYGRDMVLAGYRIVDLFRVYTLNLLLIPVNLGGVLRSVHQAITGLQSPFRRTPKVPGRTTAPALYLLAEFGLVAYCVLAAVFSLLQHRAVNATFALANALILLYGIHLFIGFRAGREDLTLNWPERWRFRSPERAKTETANETVQI